MVERKGRSVSLEMETYSGLDPPQNAVMITHLPLSSIDLPQPRVIESAIFARLRILRGNPAGSATGDLCRPSSLSRLLIRVERPNMITLFARALQPVRKVQPLRENQILH